MNNSIPNAERKRRPRYSGTHPRKFSEKYKELNPAQYPETVAKVLAAGKTPAGMHRPIMVQEILKVLAPKPGETAVDCTLGYGGHTIELLKAIQPGGKLLALDADPVESRKTEERLRAMEWNTGQLIVRNTNFAGLQKALAGIDVVSADLILADLGVSSMQLDDPERGFTFKREGPLDLRLNPGKGESAAQMLSHIEESELATILRDFSDEPRAEEIAHAIIGARREEPIRSTFGLARAIRSALLRSRRLTKGAEDEISDSIRRVFQALRIMVNDEFGALENLLRVLPSCLSSSGRVAFLTFHSGEDRRVKRSFQDGLRAGVYSEVALEPIRATAEERHANPRASSAKLRWAARA
jgi:16S rRNA (cytosine1402-N4)-methyltransferase